MKDVNDWDCVCQTMAKMIGSTHSFFLNFRYAWLSLRHSTYCSYSQCLNLHVFCDLLR